jgi:hypothetical protein
VDPAALGRHPWALPQLVMDDDTLDLLQTHLEARTAFRDLAVRWVGADGTLVHLVLSGEPRLRACEHLGKPRRRTTATRVVRA